MFVGFEITSVYNMQSVYITTKVVSSNPAHVEVYSIQHYVIIFFLCPIRNMTVQHDIICKRSLLKTSLIIRLGGYGHGI
jgi:hypothetical protein